MDSTIAASRIASIVNVRPQQVQIVLALLSDGSTIPFIARYRKDATGGLDEVQIQLIQDQEKIIREFEDRKAFIQKSIAEQGKLSEEIEKKLGKADTIAELEDIYLPFKPKRKTKAQVAKENGLEPLAIQLLGQNHIDIDEVAATFINDTILSVNDALQGARDIIAETINEDALTRSRIRKLFEDQATIQSKVVAGKEEEGVKYKDYFDFTEPIFKIPSHRILAILRGFLEGYLRMNISPDEDTAIALLEGAYIKENNDCAVHIRKAIKDAYKRLLQPSMESECRSALKLRADEEAINVFAENLKQLLLSPPLGSKRILAIDPGYRTGCKVVCLDSQGALLKTSLIFLHEGNKQFEAEHIIRSLVREFGIEVFAIGNGTAGRETEQLVKGLQLGLPVFMVNEDGASIYSASEAAREEFPDEDITVRGSVSIGRRLMDPLAELVKIDPKSIGVGQYQHDVNQYRLKERLDQTVVSCVNAVGVNLNTASKNLLQYVSGINSSVADNIVQYRKANGQFSNRKQLLQVPRLGEKAFEQCAGFMRINHGDHPLDASAVHPEAYALVERMANDLQADLPGLIGNEILIEKIDARKYISEQFGEMTIKDILRELKKPGLDPRKPVQQFAFANIFKMEDVTPGMIVPGIVTNLTRFGAFVDIGVKQDGLVHVSEMAHRFIAEPGEVVKLHQHVLVKVLEVDLLRKRIQLSIKQAQDLPKAAERKSVSVVNSKKVAQVSTPEPALPMDDALAMLKSKFKR